MASIMEVTGRWVEQVGPTTWRGFRRFVTPHANVVPYIRAMRGQAFPGFFGGDAPVILRMRGRDSRVPGLSFLETFYESKRQLGRARIRMITDERALNPWNRPLGANSKIVAGDSEDVMGNQLRIVGGEDKIMEYDPIVVVQFAMSSRGYDPLAIAALVGKVNKKNIRLLNAKAGSMRCIKIVQDQTYMDDLVYLDAYFRYSADPNGFLGACKKREGAYHTALIPSYDTDGTKIGYSKQVVFRPNKKFDANGVLITSKSVDGDMYFQADFSILNGLLVWEIVR